MQIGKQSSFKRQKNINTQNYNYFGNRDVNVEFATSLKSVNTGNLSCFTNFFPTRKCNNYKFVKKNIGDIVSNKITLVDDNLYEMRLVEFADNYFLEMKIRDIMECTFGNKVRNIPILYKFKELNNKELQYYVEKKDADNFEVKFIDIYHLVIPAPNKYIGETKENSAETYERHKNDKVCLSEIKKELNI